jgi:hypothetical protein
MNNRIFTIIKIIVSAIAIYYAFAFASTIYMNKLQLFGLPIGGTILKTVFKNEIKWKIPTGFSITTSDISSDEIADKTRFYNFNCQSNDTCGKANMILIKMHELLYINKIIVEKENLKRGLFYYVETREESRYKQVANFTPIIFNTIISPKGEYLSLFGMPSTAKKHDTTIGKLKIQFLTEDFTYIGFQVGPNRGIFRNITKKIEFYNKKTGTIAFIEANGGKRVLLIHYIDKTEMEKYQVYLKQLFYSLHEFELID